MTTACTCEHCGHEFEAEPAGGHRLLCGDATSASDVARLMDGEEADICFTSPPYAQQRDYKTGPQDWVAFVFSRAKQRRDRRNISQRQADRASKSKLRQRRIFTCRRPMRICRSLRRAFPNAAYAAFVKARRRGNLPTF
jgi:hypothetical protein